MPFYGKLELSESEAKRLGGARIVERLVATGVSRLSAERMVEIEREKLQPGRARRRAQSRP